MSSFEISSAATDGDFLLAVMNDVAVFTWTHCHYARLTYLCLTVGQPGVKVSAQVAHGDEALAPPGESEEVAAGLPVLNGLPHAGVGELYHVHDGTPPKDYHACTKRRFSLYHKPVFTCPSIAAGIREGGWLSSGWPLVRVVKVVTGHDSLEAVVVAQEEGGSYLVLPVVVVGSTGGQDSSCASVTSLVVVVVHEHHCVHPVRHAPVCVVDAPQAVEVSAADAFGKLDAVSELGDFANTKVLLDLNGLAAHVNDLVEEKRTASLREVLGHALDGLEIPWPHVLTSVHSESLDSDVNQVIEVV